jgi:hypothetical protein
VAEYLHRKLLEDTPLYEIIFAWLFVHLSGKVVSSEDFPEQSCRWMMEWRLDQIIAQTLMELGSDEGAAWRSVTLIKLLTRHQRWFEEETANQVLGKLLNDNDARQLLGVNRYDDILWFNKEAFEEMLWWLTLTAAIEVGFDPLRPAKEIIRRLEKGWSVIQKMHDAEKKAGYQVEKLLASLKGGPSSS